jgi:type II secretory pathway pseudopilin PulG
MKLKNNAGFTLIESVLMVFVIALLLVALFSLYDWHSKVYVYQRAVVHTTEQARFSTQT